MSRLPDDSDPDGQTSVDEVVVLGKRGTTYTEIPSHMVGVGDPAYDPSNPPSYTAKDYAIQDVINSLNEDGSLSAEEIALINVHEIQLNEILPDGIYQMEFNVAGIGEHRQ